MKRGPKLFHLWGPQRPDSHGGQISHNSKRGRKCPAPTSCRCSAHALSVFGLSNFGIITDQIYIVFYCFQTIVNLLPLVRYLWLYALFQLVQKSVSIVLWPFILNYLYVTGTQNYSCCYGLFHMLKICTSGFLICFVTCRFSSLCLGTKYHLIAENNGTERLLAKVVETLTLSLAASLHCILTDC